MAQRIEIIESPKDIALTKDEVLDQAFELIELAIQSGHRFSDHQKDIGVRLSLDALPPDNERAWFLEVSNMNRMPLWQVLWGSWRRCQEWGVAQAPLTDPGWKEGGIQDYGLAEVACKECGTVFKPRWQGEIFHSNACGVAEEKRRLEERVAMERSRRTQNAVPDDMMPTLRDDGEPSVDLGVDVVES